MPTVSRAADGVVIKSRRRGQYITHQLDSAGEQYLRDQYGFVDKLEIDVPTLLHLKRLGHAYTGRQLREQRRRARGYEQGTLFGSLPPAPPPQPASRRQHATASPSTSAPSCADCRSPVPAEAQFCQRCGKRLGSAPAPAPVPAARADYAWVYVVLAALAVIAVFVLKK
jgi:hypothetical protein